MDDWNVQSDEKSVTAIIGIFASFVETEAGWANHFLVLISPFGVIGNSSHHCLIIAICIVDLRLMADETDLLEKLHINFFRTLLDLPD